MEFIRAQINLKRVRTNLKAFNKNHDYLEFLLSDIQCRLIKRLINHEFHPFLLMKLF